MIQGHDIVCLAPSEWRDNPVSNTHLMARLATENRVLYVETPGNRLPTLRDAGRVVRQLRNFVAGPRAFTSSLAPSTFTLYTPLAVPYQGSRLIRSLNRRWLAWSLGRVARRRGFRSPIVWTFSPYYLPILDAFKPKLVVYHIVDELSTYLGASPQEFAALERSMIQRADLVLVASRRLWERKQGINPRTHQLPNAADVEHIGRSCDPATRVAPEIAGLPHPVIGYVGTMADWVDYDLLVEMAQAHPSWSLAFVGYVHARTDSQGISQLKALPNVHLLGQQPFARLPEFYHGFDVCIIPFHLTEHTQYSNPVKIYEYLATGLPVVTTDLAPAHEFRHLLRIAKSRAEFIGHVESALSVPDPKGRTARLEEAKRHTWDARVEQASALLDEALHARVRV